MGLFTKKNVPPEEPSRLVPAAQKAKPFRIELGWRGMFSLVVVVFFLFFWMFVLGIWAGQTILLPTRENRLMQPAKRPPAPPAPMVGEKAGPAGQPLRPSGQ